MATISVNAAKLRIPGGSLGTLFHHHADVNVPTCCRWRRFRLTRSFWRSRSSRSDW